MSGLPNAVPVLPVADLGRALVHYERLGFQVEATFGGYAIVVFDGTEVHLAEAPEVADLETWTGVYLRVDDADALHTRWSAMGAPMLSPPTDQAYGVREFATEDPDGNLWRVGSPISTDPDPDLPAAAVFVDEFAEALNAASVDGTGPSTGPLPPSTEKDPTPPPADTPTERPITSIDWFALVSEGQTCPECALVNGELQARAIGAECRDLAHALGELLLEADDAEVRVRPTPSTWSALEYGVHARDMLNVFAQRIVRALAEHNPDLAAWDETEVIADGMANESDVGAVADDLGRNASKLSEALRLVSDDDWDRPATVAGTWRFTIELMARVALHELVHHTLDARRSLDEARA